jgi:hypothetical protein
MKQPFFTICSCDKKLMVANRSVGCGMYLCDFQQLYKGSCRLQKKSNARIDIVNKIVYISKKKRSENQDGQLEEQLDYTTHCYRSER